MPKTSYFCYITILTCLISGNLIGCTTEAPDPVSEPPANLYVEQGKTLAKGFAACGFCHGDKNSPGALLSGGRAFYDTYGEVIAPNISPVEGGFGDWTTVQIMKLFRAGQRPDESTISTDLHEGFEWMSDDDLLSIISYLKNTPPVENETEVRNLSMISRNTTGFFESVKVVTGFVPDIEKSYQLEYGQYLVDHVARCGSCHNTKATMMNEEKYLTGGEIFKTASGEKVAPNITQSETEGIGSWSEEEIVEYLQSGSAPGGKESDPDFCPVRFYKYALPQDLISVAKYLKSVPALN